MSGAAIHIAGYWLATLRVVERMAEKMGDQTFAEDCRAWYERGSKSMEEKLWNESAGSYLLFNNVSSGERSDTVLSDQLVGQWLAQMHSLPKIFADSRVDRVLETIWGLNVASTPYGVRTGLHPDGATDRSGYYSSLMVPSYSSLVPAMLMINSGDEERGGGTYAPGLAPPCDRLANGLGYAGDVECRRGTRLGIGVLPQHDALGAANSDPRAGSGDVRGGRRDDRPGRARRSGMLTGLSRVRSLGRCRLAAVLLAVPRCIHAERDPLPLNHAPHRGLPWIPTPYRGTGWAFDHRKDEKTGLCGFGPGTLRAPPELGLAVAFVLGRPSVGAGVWT